jgi:flagellar export protein FliJ
MKPFRFPLQPLRAVREHKEQVVRERYARALRACEEAAALVQAASAELSACWTRLREQMASGATGDEMLRSRAWCNVLELRVKARAATLAEARLVVDAVWKELLLATRERKTLERFYDKRRRAYDGEVQREEQKLLDETAIQMVHFPTLLRPVNSAVAL